MSFILDALRKVDQENRQSGEVVPPVVAVEKQRKERVHRRRQFVAMAVIAVSSAAATAFLLRRPPAAEPAQPPAPALQAAPVELLVVPPAEASELRVEVPVESRVLKTTIASPDVMAEESPPAPPRRSERAAPPEIAREAPAAKPSSEPPSLVLQGTSVLDGRPVAVVSDRRVFEGDMIQGALVIRIEERSVELEFEGRRFILTL